MPRCPGGGQYPGHLPAACQCRRNGQGADGSARHQGKNTGATGKAAGGGAAPGGAPAISEAIKIVADVETNSLIITGPREEYEAVETVIKKFGHPRRMVYLRP